MKSRATRRHYYAAVRDAGERRYATLQFGRVAHGDRRKLNSKRLRHALDGGKLADAGCRRGIPKDRRAPDVGCNLLEQFHPFPAHAVFEISEPRGVAAWSRQALEDASANRIGEICEYDGNGASCLLHRRDRDAAHGYDHVWRECNQFGCILTNTLDLASGK